MLKMPRHCPRVCILLLLPLTALSCSSRLPGDMSMADRAIIQTELLSARENIDNLLLNTTCLDLKAKPSCSPSHTSLVKTLFTISCRVKKLSVPQTSRLTSSVELSVACLCPEPATKELKRSSRTSRNDQHKHKKQIKKLCRTRTLLSSLEECFHFLNTRTSAGPE